MLDKILNLKKEITLNKKGLPKHIALTLAGNADWAKIHKKPLEEAYSKQFATIEKLVSLQVSLNIPVFTIFLLSEELRDSERFALFKELMIDFFNRLKDSKLIHEKQIKVSALGKWYDLPYRLIESIKSAFDVTKDYDKFFLNFCVNYNGQQEIVDACKLIARKVKAGKLDPDSINDALIKENTYSSYFIPPSLIIITGKRKKTSGILLWDSSNSIIFFSEKLLPEFTSLDFLDAIKFFQKK